MLPFNTFSVWIDRFDSCTRSVRSVFFFFKLVPFGPVPAMAVVDSDSSYSAAIVVHFRSLLRRREELSKSEYRAGLGRDSQGADRDVENRSYPDIGRVRPLHASVLEPWTAIEAARTARASLQTLEHDLPRRVHPRAVHRNSPARRTRRFSRRPPDRTPPRPRRRRMIH